MMLRDQTPLVAILAAMILGLVLSPNRPAIAADKPAAYLLTERERALIANIEKRPRSAAAEQRIAAGLYRVATQVAGKTKGRYLGRPITYLKALYVTLSGPPDKDELVDGRYLLTSGCRQHSCIEKGAIFADSRSGHVATALLHYIDEKDRYHPIGTLLIMHKACADADFVRAAQRKFEQWLKDKAMRAEVRVATTPCRSSARR